MESTPNISAVPSGRKGTLVVFQTLRVWLLSGCASSTSRNRGRGFGRCALDNPIFRMLPNEKSKPNHRVFFGSGQMKTFFLYSLCNLGHVACSPRHNDQV